MSTGLLIAIIGIVGILILAILVRRKMVAAGKRWSALLNEYPAYSGKQNKKNPEVIFHYSDPGNNHLKELRGTYQLDTIAGNGPEIDRIINLMKWVNHLTWHHPNPGITGPFNSLSLISLCKGWKRGINCWMFAIILNEVYLSMGFASRLVHLKPHSNEQKESHFATSVYSKETGKWIYMDPDFGGYFKDESGNILGVPEIRRRLITGEPLVVNKDVRGFTKILGRSSYPWYLSRNIFRYTCSQDSTFDQETDRKDRLYYELIPDGYHEELLLESRLTRQGARIISINDEVLFWQEP